ncbi:hypothetical protein [Shewanella waksmanii]|uniref:hypothetical protein n=1 Tax=Shewanella waksmanii TaxID=213783 RepID=UPI00373526A0
MDGVKFNFLPKFEISNQIKDIVQQISGKRFVSDGVRISFCELVPLSNLVSEYIELKIVNQGINVDVLVSKLEVERLVGSQLDLLSYDYIGYLISRTLGLNGVSLGNMGSDVGKSDLFYIRCVFYVGGFNFEGALKINEFSIDSDYLLASQNTLSGSTSLSVELAPFYTELTPKEIQDLNSGELVMVYEK